MPYIEAKLSIELNDSQKDELQAKLVQAVSSAFTKPNAYIMTNIEDEKSLYMGDKKVEKGAYVEVKALGTVTKRSCQTAKKTICDIVTNDYGLEVILVYITYQPVDMWGWNGSMF